MQILHSIKKFLKISNQKNNEGLDHFLNHVTGVIHVGANIGHEINIYNNLGLDVVWVEPIPEIFKTLQENLNGLTKQRAFQCLITDCEDEDYQFHISNNNGESSSILDLKLHRDIWPEVSYTNTINLKSITLTSLTRNQNINMSQYQALVMDTQGSELLVLKGSIPLLKNIKYIKTEVPDFESYTGCCQLDDINSFMIEHGYKEYSRKEIASRTEGGSYYDIVYKKR